MATYDLNRTELNGALSDQGIDANIRAKIISTLEQVGVYGDDHGHGHGHHDQEALTSIIHDGESPSGKADVVIYTDEVSGFVDGVPKDATAVVFGSDEGVAADIGGSGQKIIVSGDGNDFLTMTGNSNDEIFGWRE
jgi:hypothetical protein